MSLNGEVQPYAQQGRALLVAGRAADALRVLTAGCARCPDTPELLMLRGRALLRLGQPGAALRALILASTGLLRDPALHSDLSDALGALGQLGAATDHAAEAQRLDGGVAPDVRQDMAALA